MESFDQIFMLLVDAKIVTFSKNSPVGLSSFLLVQSNKICVRDAATDAKYLNSFYLK